MGSSNRRTPSELTFSMKELGAIFLFLSGLVSGWVSLNNSQVETNTKLTAFEIYYKESLKNYKISNEKSLAELKQLIKSQKNINKELAEQVSDLERNVTQIYRITSRKK